MRKNEQLSVYPFREISTVNKKPENIVERYDKYVRRAHHELNFNPSLGESLPTGVKVIILPMDDIETAKHGIGMGKRIMAAGKPVGFYTPLIRPTPKFDA